MPDHPNQPQEYDAVLGGQTPIPTGSAVLGGIESIKRRLASRFEGQRIATLSEALKYGEAGLDLVIGGLQDESVQIEKTAYLLLRERTEPRVKQALREYSPCRFFECLHTLSIHSVGSINSIAILPDGKTIVSESRDDNTIKVWHLVTGKLLRIIETPTGDLNSIAITPDGKTLVSCAHNSIYVWCPVAGELLRTIKGHSGGVRSVAISPDGQTLVSCTHNSIYVWCPVAGELLRTIKGHSMYDLPGFCKHLAISPDGQTLVTLSWNQTVTASWSYSNSTIKTIKVWHLVTGELLRTIEAQSQSFTSVAICPDGKTFVSIDGYNTINVWHLATGELIRTLEAPSPYVYSVAFSPDGKTLVRASYKTIKVWHFPTGELVRTLEGHSSNVYSVAFSPDGKTLVSKSYKTIKIWGMP